MACRCCPPPEGHILSALASQRLEISTDICRCITLAGVRQRQLPTPSAAGGGRGDGGPQRLRADAHGRRQVAVLPAARRHGAGRHRRRVAAAFPDAGPGGVALFADPETRPGPGVTMLASPLLQLLQDLVGVTVPSHRPKDLTVATSIYVQALQLALLQEKSRPHHVMVRSRLKDYTRSHSKQPKKFQATCRQFFVQSSVIGRQRTQEEDVSGPASTLTLSMSMTLSCTRTEPLFVT